jgi:hypothetical protein
MTRDERDAQTWAVVELSRAGERLVEEGKMEGVLRHLLKCPPSHPIFVPAVFYPSLHQDEPPIVLSVTEGYVFIAAGLPDQNLYALEQHPYFRRVLATIDGGYRVLRTVPDSSLEELRKGLANLVASSITAGMSVTILHGLLMGLEGRIVNETSDSVDVYVELRSIRLLRRLPKTSVRPVRATGG